MAGRSVALCTVTRWALVALLCAVACGAARTMPQLGNASSSSNGENPQEGSLDRVSRTLEQAGTFPAGSRVVEVNSEEVRNFSSRGGHVETTRLVSIPAGLIGGDPTHPIGGPLLFPILLLTPCQSLKLSYKT